MKGSQTDNPTVLETAPDTPATEQVIEIPLVQLHPFEGHPFKVQDDDAMLEMADSIRQYGVLVPGIVTLILLIPVLIYQAEIMKNRHEAKTKEW